MVNNSIFSSQLREELEFTSFVENNKSPLLILELAQDLARGKLQDFAKTRDFVNQMTQVFGEGHNLVDLQSDWTAGEAFFPAIEVRTIDELDGAYGAFSQDTGRIYLAQELLERSSPDAINAILLEEYGHFIDAQLNLLDTLGDEGAMFSAFVRGETLTSQEIQGIAIEDDIVTITLDDRIIQIEKASISGSGGEGGTNQTIQLDPLPSNQTNKGNVTVKYSYEHFSIPDQFTIRYEGKNIFDTGGLVSGSRSGTVTIPRGEENSIEVKVTAPEEGTAWNFFVTTESCSDTTPLKIEAVGGEFKDSDGDGDCEFDGTVIIGRTDGNPELIRVANGTVEYDDKEIRVTNGTVFSKIGNVSSPLFQGDFTIPFSSARSSSFKEKGNIANDFKLGGLDVDFKSIFLDQNDIKLGTEFSLPEEITGSAIKVTLLPDGIPSSNANVKPDALIISNNGVQLGASSKVKLPDLGSFKLFNLAEIGASDLSISYSAPDDTLKLQGKLSLSKFTKSEKPTLEADLSGKNFIQVRDGKADVKGSLSVKNVGLPGGWGLEEAKITLDTIANKVGGEVGVTFPWGKTVPPKNVGAKLGLDFMIDPLQLDGISAGVTLPDPGVPVGTTGIFLNGVDGSIGNLAPSDSNLIEFQGGVDLSGGPKFLGGSLIKADLDVKVNPNELSGSGKLTLIDDKIANANGNTTLNWNKGFLKTKSNFSILDGTITTNSSFTATSAFDIKFGGQASVNVPKSIPVIGGKSLASGDYAFDFSNNGNSSDDFAAGWGQFNIPLVFSTITITAGVKGSFDGQFEFIGARNIPETNSFDVETGTEWVVLSADWENANPNTKVRIKTPTGAFIDEVDFAANNFTIVPDFTDEDTRAIAIPNPSPGIWDIVVVDSTGLGTIDYHAIRDSIAPTIEITSPISDISSNGSVNIGFNALDSDSTAKIQLFYDDDNTGLDGILLTDSLVENDGVDSFTWNTEGVPTGEYYIYALIMDDENVPVFSDYSTGKVKITESVDIAVTSTISSDAAVIEDNFTYKIAVKNEGNSTSKGVVLTNSLPSEVTFISASIAPSQQSEDELIFNLGDLGSGETKSLEIVVKAPATPTTISNTVSASSQTFDPSINNNTSILVTSIEPSTASADLSLTAVSTNTPLKIGDRLSYDFLITNNGTSTATEVVLNASPPSGLQNIITSEGQIDINTITANLGSINAGESKTVSISGDIITAGTLTFTASVQNSQTDSNVLNNSLILQHPVSATIPSPADLELAMSVDRPRAKVGDLVTIQLTLTNKGSGAATAIQVKNLLPQGLNFVSSSAQQGRYDSATGIWDVGNVAKNNKASLNIVTSIVSTGLLENTAEVIAVNETDPDSTPNNNNSVEDDQATLKIVGTVSNLTKIGDDIFNLSSSSGKPKLKINLIESNSDMVNELGVFTVDDDHGQINGISPGEAGYTEAALDRAKAIFSTIAALPNGFNPQNLGSILEFDSGSNLRFLLVKNSTIDSVQSGKTPTSEVFFSDLSRIQITDLGTDGFSLAWKDGSGNATDFKDLVVKIQSTDDSLPLGTNLQNGQQGELLDLRDLSSTQTINADFSIYREANFNNFVGFYQIDDPQGTIIDALTGQSLNPGDSDYAEVAVRDRIAGIDLQVSNQSTRTISGTLQGGFLFAPFIIVDGSPNQFLDTNPFNDPTVYFPFLDANSDGIDHVRLLANNVFGFEDLPRGGDLDYNDIIISADLTIV